MVKQFVYFFLLLSMYSCQTAIHKDAAIQKKEYFDLKDFFNQEIARLEKSNDSFKKTVKIGDKSETQTPKEVDWKQELQIFVESDINKTAWFDKYQKDTTENKITYTAQDDNLKIRSIHLHFANPPYTAQFMEEVEIINHTENVLYESAETLKYWYRQHNWHIVRTQKVATGGTETVEILGGFEGF